MAQDDWPDLQCEGWLRILGTESLCQWDVLVFLDRHQSSLVSAEYIARLLGYATAEVVGALDSLEYLRLVARSRASRGVRLCQLSSPSDSTRSEALEWLMTFADSYTVRRLLARRLRGSGRRYHKTTTAGHMASTE